MLISYAQAFGLNDNPFGPKQALPGVQKVTLMQSLERNHLLVHAEPALLDLYCATAGPFEAFCAELEIILATAGYQTNPPSRGVLPHAFVVNGDRGTGKTTLASKMISLVKSCTPVGAKDWCVKELMLDGTARILHDQLQGLEEIRKQTLAGSAPNDYVCLLIDDLVSEAYGSALKVFDALGHEQRIVVMFITSSDPALSEEGLSGSKHSVKVFPTDQLTPDGAVAFVTHRLNLFRPKPPLVLNKQPLFPFVEKDVRQAVGTASFLGKRKQGPVTLRLLGSVLHSALQQRLFQLSKSKPPFDVQQLTAAVLDDHLIRLSETYSSMVLAA